MTSLAVTQEELALLKMLLSKEEVTTRVEIHHSRTSFEYKDYLKGREKEIRGLLEKVKEHLPGEQ